MKYNYKKMDKQLAELERLFQPTHPRGIVWTDFLGQAEHDGLAPDERIVEDYFDDSDGDTVIITERITDDASDEGKDFLHGTWDRKRLDAINRSPARMVLRIVLKKKRRSKWRPSR